MRTLVPSCKGWKRLTAAVCAGLMAGAFSFLPVAEARGGELLPQGGGSSTASIVTDSGTMNITGAANNVIKWVSFSIGEGNAVKFDNKNYLNYVTGHARSEILGTLTGGGHIYLVNPNGILIGDNARIDVGNLYLSTRNLTTDQLTDYATATRALFKAGDLNGDVINMGKLNADVITVEGKNITFKNVADVTKGGKLENGNITGGTLNDAVTLTANSGGEIHIGSETGRESGYITSGTTYNYQLVNNVTELQAMKDNLSGNYMLAGNIDMSGTDFEPIGYSFFTHMTKEDTYAFSGRFDGLGYAVKNLSVNFNYEVPDNPEDSPLGIGLFGSSTGVIENVKLSGGSIESGQGCVGIIGINSGTVRNVFNEGVAVTGAGNVGGIVGANYTGTIKNVWNTGAVSGSAANVGGIAGDNNIGASIENAWNNGDISGSDYVVGGIAGNNQDGIVQNVYNTGAVHSDRYGAGGIVGVNQGSNTRTIVEYAYNTGTVTSSNSDVVGGIVGKNYAIIRNAYSQEGTAAGVYGNNFTSGTTVKVAMKSATDMKNAATFTDFDFSDGGAWRIYEGNTMPLLTAFMKKEDNIVSIEYDETDTGDIGARYVETTYNNTEAQVGGANYISDVYVTLPVQSAPSNPEGGGSSGGSGGSGGSGTPTSPVNPSNPVAPATPVNPVEPAPINPAEPIPANPAGPTPGIPAEPSSAAPGQAVTNPASGALRPEGTLAERVIAEVEAENLSLGTVTELENAAETAKEQPFAKDMAAVAEMGAVEANAPLPAPSDSGHSYTMLDGGLVAVRDDVNSAPASAVMGSNPGHHNVNEVMAAAAQADLTIGTEEVHNRQDNGIADEDSDEKDKKQSEQN